MQELFKCKCGCSQFINVTPHQYLKPDMDRWGSFGHRVFGIAPVLICVNCNYITIPPINMSGKSRLDPNVQAFADLVTTVETANKRIDSINELFTRIQKLEDAEKSKEED